MEIRKLTSIAVGQMQALEADSGLEPYTVEMLQDCVENLYSLGCFDGKRLVGFVTVNGNSRYLGGSVYIVNLNVAQAYRRKGIASRLIREGCRRFRDGKLVTLDVETTNPARSLYHALGFREMELPSRNGDTDVAMAVPMEKLLGKRLRCVWEHNGNDSLIYAVDYPGAYTRGESRAAALQKLEGELRSYLKWKGEPGLEDFDVEIVQEKDSDLEIRDADSDVLFQAEREPLTMGEYTALRDLALKSAADFLTLYRSIPDSHKSCLPQRKTFYGQVPRTAAEMYGHTKNVNDYYFGEIGVEADNEGDILSCRRRGFEALEAQPDFLTNRVVQGSFGEEWSLRKLLRRFLWHDRIHAKAMYRMAVKTFGAGNVRDIFCFG